VLRAQTTRLGEFYCRAHKATQRQPTRKSEGKPFLLPPLNLPPATHASHDQGDVGVSVLVVGWLVVVVFLPLGRI
jgi:hypothetical protein